MIFELTEEERTQLGFHLACRLEDLEKIAKKQKSDSGIHKVIQELEEFTYTKVIPESWSGPKPDYWKNK